MAAIFISHSSADKEQSKRMKCWLAEIGFDEVFLDFDKHQGIPLGSDWEKQLYEKMGRCRAVLLIVTKNWLSSKWCFAEFTQARALGKSIFVVIETPKGETKIAPDLQVCDLTVDPEGGRERLRIALEEVLLVAQSGFPFPRDRAPYPGLVSFEGQDAAVFFGRDSEITAIFEWVKSERSQQRRALVILGGSGVGKSSLLRAGALPRLERERDGAGKPRFLVAPAFRPSDSPLRELLAALRTLDDTLTLDDVARATTPEAARDLVDRLREKAAAHQAILVLAIDQGEELFAAADAFGAVLAAFASRGVPARLLIGMRANYLDDLQKIPGLSDAIEALPIRPMPIERLGEVIQGPARRVDLAVDDGLVEAIKADAKTADALPLVAFVLRELYERVGRKSKRLDRDNYAAMRVGELSPLESAVRSKADETVRGASEEAIAALREAFLSGLVRVNEEGQFARRGALRSALPEAALPLIDRLLVARLIADKHGADAKGQGGGETPIEVAHEALFRVWPRLASWLDDERDFLAGRARIEQLRLDHEALPEADRARGLLSGILLERARTWLAEHPGRFPAPEARFIEASAEAADAEVAAREAEREHAREAELARAKAEADRLQERVRGTRRLLAGAVIAALALGGLGLWAWRQRNTAVEQQARAERALTLATDTANGLVFEVAQKFRNVVGVPATMIKDVLDRVLQLQEQLLSGGELSPELRRSQAAALMEMTDTLLTLGDTKSALAVAQQARDIFQALVMQQPVSTDFQDDLWASYIKVGDVLVAQGDLSGALKSYRDGLAVAERLAASDPKNEEWQRDLSVSHGKVGDLLVAQGNLVDALRSFRYGLAIFERLAKSNPGNAGWQRDLPVSYDKIGGVLLAQGDRVGALKFYRDGLAITQRLAASDPGNAQLQSDLSLSYERVGNVQVVQGELPGALKSYRDGLAIAERLAASDPDNVQWRRGLWVSYNKIGDVLVAQGALAGALNSYRGGLTIAERLATSDPDNVQWRRDLSISYNMVGDVLLAQGDRAGALKSYRHGLAIAEGLATIDPANAIWQHDLSVSYSKVANVLVAQGDLAGALKSYRYGLAIGERLAASDPGDASWQSDLSVSYDQVGDVLVAQGDLAGALKAYRDGLAIRERLAASDSGNTEWQRELSLSRARVGDVLMAQGKLDDALESYRDGLVIAERLAASDPSNTEWQRDLSVSYERVGNVLVAQGNREGALKSYRDSLAIRERLAISDPSNARWQRDLTISCVKIAEAAPDQAKPMLMRALEIAKRLRDEGRLAPADAGMIDELTSKLAALGD